MASNPIIAHCPRCNAFSATYVGETCAPCMEQIYKSNPGLREEHAVRARLASLTPAEPDEPIEEEIGQLIEDELFPLFGAGPYEALAAKIKAMLSQRKAEPEWDGCECGHTTFEEHRASLTPAEPDVEGERK